MVNGSDIWLDQGELPFGDAHTYDLPKEKAVVIAEYQGHSVYWLNDADVERGLEMSSLRTTGSTTRIVLDRE